jgi:hypothetical protein
LIDVDRRLLCWPAAGGEAPAPLAADPLVFIHGIGIGLLPYL